MFIKTKGKKVFAATGGQPLDASKPCIVFIHGAAMDHSVWMQQTRYFAHHGYSVLAPDLPGHGRSDGGPLDTVARIADWVCQIMDASEIGQAIMVGHSLGGLVALEIASQKPERVFALALLGVSAPMPVHGDLLSKAEINDHLAFDLINDWGHSRGSQIGCNQVPGIWLTGSAIRLLELASDGVLYADLKAVRDYNRGLEVAANLVCPTFILIGSQDRMTPPKASQSLAKRIAKSQSVVLEDCGHMAMLEKPDTVRTELSKYFAQLVTK